MSSYPRIYVSIAFFTGIILTLGFKDFYPDLERRFRHRWDRRKLTLKNLEAVASTGEQFAQAHNISVSQVETAAESKKTGEEIREGVEACIGNTPLFKIKSLSEATGCEILGKAEFLNGGGGSPKDRVALSMIKHAEEQGLLTPHSGDTIYEGTVGSTGISLATLCRSKGYLAHIYMPSDQAIEKSDLLSKLGAMVDRVPPVSIIDPQHYVNLARTEARAHTDDSSRRGRGYFADQFENEANWMAHFESTGPEIYSQCNGKVDAFIAGAGTGGTISGVAKYLKSKLPNVKIILADPQGSGLFNRVKFGVMFDPREKEGTRRRHQVDSVVEGIGVNRITANFESGRELVDDAIKITDEQATKMSRWLVEKDGLFLGSSSAVNCTAALKLARELGPGHRIVAILCDSGTRHLSKFWKEVGPIGSDTEMKLDDII
jgi:cysteine synthase A